MISSERKEYLCVLIDDDEWALLDFQNTIPFEKYGFRVAGIYRNAEDALAGIRKFQPALIVTDICLGGLSGLELISQCRKGGFSGECIIISGYSEFEYARMAIATDVSTYLLKPVDAQEAGDALRRVREKLDGHVQSYDDREHLIDHVIQYIRDNHQKPLSLDDVANTFFINKTYLSELFHEKTGKNFVQYKNEVRIERAKILLSDTSLTISQISTQCGFDNASYFAFVFRQITGMSPRQYRDQ